MSWVSGPGGFRVCLELWVSGLGRSLLGKRRSIRVPLKRSYKGSISVLEGN